MDWTAVFTAMKPILAQATRDGLRIIGMGLATHGFIQNGAGTEAFVGAGMTLAGLFWGWFTTSGYLKVGALLKKLTAQKTQADAVSAAQVLPPAAAVDTALKSASAQSAVAKILIAAVAVSLLLAGTPAFAQTKKFTPTGNLVGDIQAATTPDKPKLITGDVEKDAHAIWDKLVAASNADLKYASALAGVANTSASLVRKQCYDAILELNTQVNGMNLKDANGNPLPQPDPKLFTGVEQAAETIDNLSPSGKLFTSCAGMAQLTKTNVLTLINAIVTGAAGFAAMPIIPGL
jgi:hypothetical protein